jgi:hypothetical protein
MREAWAESWARLLKPGGQLITLVFPVDSKREGGPPWAVTPELYEELLPKSGKDVGSDACMVDRMDACHEGGMFVARVSAHHGMAGRVPHACPHIDTHTMAPGRNAGFKLQSMEPVPSHLSHPTREGMEYLGIWQREHSAAL